MVLLSLKFEDERWKECYEFCEWMSYSETKYLKPIFSAVAALGDDFENVSEDNIKKLLEAARTVRIPKESIEAVAVLPERIGRLTVRDLHKIIRAKDFRELADIALTLHESHHLAVLYAKKSGEQTPSSPDSNIAEAYWKEIRIVVDEPRQLPAKFAVGFIPIFIVNFSELLTPDETIDVVFVTDNDVLVTDTDDYRKFPYEVYGSAISINELPDSCDEYDHDEYYEQLRHCREVLPRLLVLAKRALVIVLLTEYALYKQLSK